jgi:uncharacterized NAD-dependent epimerase/dehydratase family protein
VPYFDSQTTPLVILAEAYFATRHAKTATGVLRYGDWPVTAVIDSTSVGKDLSSYKEVLKDTKIVSCLDEALKLSPRPQALLIGIAPIGGELPKAWLDLIEYAIKQGLHIINGLHEYLNDNLELVNLAKKHSVILWDVRNPSSYEASKDFYVAKHNIRQSPAKVITMVGTDCNVGKMCTALELQQGLMEKGIRASFIATGQTGIMISGDGVPLDRTICDFSAGAIERAIDLCIRDNPEVILVEGQGSLLHPGYSAVTLALMHGSKPDYMILCTKAGAEKILGGYDVRIPALDRVIEIYESASSWLATENYTGAKVIGVSANTSSLDQVAADEYISNSESLTKLPCADLFKSGKEKLINAIIQSCSLKARK